MSSSIYINAHCVTTNTSSWSQIMYYLDGFDKGDVAIITGEHEDINLKFLNNMWIFSREWAHYISYGSDRNQIYKYAQLSSYGGWATTKIGRSKYISTRETSSINSLERAIREEIVFLVCIENFPFTDFQNEINEIKNLAKKLNVAILVYVNKKYVDLDTVLNCESLNKILYFTKNSVHLYTSEITDGLQIATKISPGGYCVIEDHTKPCVKLDAKKVEAKFKEESKKEQFQKLQLTVEKQQEEVQQQEEKQQQELQMQQTFH